MVHWLLCHPAFSSCCKRSCSDSPCITAKGNPARVGTVLSELQASKTGSLSQVIQTQTFCYGNRKWTNMPWFSALLHKWCHVSYAFKVSSRRGQEGSLVTWVAGAYSVVLVLKLNLLFQGVLY